MNLAILFTVVGLTVLQCHPAHAQNHQNITKRSDRRFYDGAIYIHPPYDSPSSNSFHPRFRNEGRFGRGHNTPFSHQSPSRQTGFSHCNGGNKCQFFLYCWLSGGSLGPSCGPLFSCCVSGNEPHGKQVATPTTQRSFGPVKNDPYCGRSATRTSRIVGGNDAYFGQFPWQAVIQVGGSRCGGALVGRRFVVTAGHCVARSQHKPNNIRVTLGDYVLHSNVESLPAEVFGVSEVRLHPNFRFTPQADRFDVAVVVLDRPVPYRENIRPICIPRKGTDFLGKTAYAAGWGALEPGSKLRPKVLQFVAVPVINNKVCETWHRKQGINIRIHDEMMCAGYEYGGRDACQGDSGGPLMMEENNVWFLIGNRLSRVLVRKAVSAWHLPQGVQLFRLGLFRSLLKCRLVSYHNNDRPCKTEAPLLLYCSAAKKAQLPDRIPPKLPEGLKAGLESYDFFYLLQFMVKGASLRKLKWCG